MKDTNGKTQQASRKNGIDDKVLDYSKFHEGDTDPSTGKIIRKLIMNTTDYIVYLDQDYRIQWETTDNYLASKGNKYSDLFGEVITKVTELEGLSEVSVLPEAQKREYRTLLGSAITMMLEKEKDAVIRGVLREADRYLNDRMTELARKWYLLSSSGVTLLACIAFMLLWVFRDGAESIFQARAVDVMLGTGLGALGALFSIITRSSKLRVNVSAGRAIHYIEGTARVVVGMIGALLVALAIEAGMFLGVINTSTYSLTLLLAVCLIAGASERMAPSIIRRVEGMAENEKKTASENPEDEENTKT
mgnify:CR=1 FL=1